MASSLISKDLNYAAKVKRYGEVQMKWVAKLAVQRAISPLPNSHEINHIFQRHVSRRLPTTDKHLLKKAGWARAHLAAHERNAGLPLSRVHAYEFGGGWDLAVPLCYWAAGINRQTIIDIASHLRLDMLEHSLQRFSVLHSELEDALERPLRRIESVPLTTISDLESNFGIEYLAPRDARCTGFESGTFDLITSSDTLEHIRADDLPPILRECGRLLSSTGIMSHMVDMMDHYRYVDRSITVYNFLKFSNQQWRLLNSPIEPQNRLRISDYRTLLEASELTILEEDLRRPTDADISSLANMKIARAFANYSIEDLGAKSVRFTAVSGRDQSPTVDGSPGADDDRDLRQG